MQEREREKKKSEIPHPTQSRPRKRLTRFLTRLPRTRKRRTRQCAPGSSTPVVSPRRLQSCRRRSSSSPPPCTVRSRHRTQKQPARPFMFPTLRARRTHTADRRTRSDDATTTTTIIIIINPLQERTREVLLIRKVVFRRGRYVHRLRRRRRHRRCWNDSEAGEGREVGRARGWTEEVWVRERFGLWRLQLCACGGSCRVW